MADPKRRFAANRGRTTLYKFRAFRTPEQRERVRQILVNHRVYFARRSQLNDPFDLSPMLRFDRNRARLLAEAERAWRRREPSLTQEQIHQRVELLAHGDLDVLEAGARERTLARLESAYWVFSLAGNRDHPMLWSHYAEGHTGLCIHFSASRTSPFGASQAVLYKPSRPTLPVPLPESEHEVAMLLTLSKGMFWRYEEEYRFIRYPNTPLDEFGLRFDGQSASFPARLLTGISVGARMPAADVDTIRELVREHEPPLPVWRAEETKTYRFKFQRVQ